MPKWPELIIEHRDIDPWVKQGIVPELIFPAPSGEVFWIRIQPTVGADPKLPEWAVTFRGEGMPVPLVPYLVPEGSGFGPQELILWTVWESIKNMPGITKLKVILGDTTLQDMQKRFWLGIVAQTDNKLPKGIQEAQ